MPSFAIRNISDTAAWVAMYRARESEREDAVFRDPYARRLAGARGEEIMRTMKAATKHAWSYVARTYLFDTYIAQEIAAGADMIVNLAAGLDTRPYRMQLPASLQWIEVDLPDLIAYKEDILRAEKPVCKLERVRLDLSRLEFLDSSGVNALVVGLRDARNDGWDLEVDRRLSSQVERVVTVSGVGPFLWPSNGD